MTDLNFVNLLQAGIVTAGIMGGLLLWLTKPFEYRGIAILLIGIALSACINILEESGLTRDIYLISPIFIMLFGPGFYLAAKLLVEKQLTRIQFLHLSPVVLFLIFTSYASAVIGVGTIWRLTYAVLTMLTLIKYKASLDNQRSDSDEYSLNWLVWLLIITSVFNLADLVRLNFQHDITHQLNIIGQGINNFVWLIAAMVIVIKLQVQKALPQMTVSKSELGSENSQHSLTEDYQSIFSELDKLITEHQWFLKPRLTLSDISELTGLQTRDVSRAINVIADKSFNEYINSYRVNHVCSVLLKNDGATLSDISADSGFTSKASFNKVFKQVSGMTPTEYKNQH